MQLATILRLLFLVTIVDINQVLAASSLSLGSLQPPLARIQSRLQQQLIPELVLSDNKKACCQHHMAIRECLNPHQTLKHCDPAQTNCSKEVLKPRPTQQESMFGFGSGFFLDGSLMARFGHLRRAVNIPEIWVNALRKKSQQCN